MDTSPRQPGSDYLEFATKRARYASGLQTDLDWLADAFKGPLRADFRRFLESGNGPDEIEAQEATRFLTRIWLHCHDEATRRCQSED